jgi:hypothetical protein
MRVRRRLMLARPNMARFDILGELISIAWSA